MTGAPKDLGPIPVKEEAIMSDPEKKTPQGELSEEELGEMSGGLIPSSPSGTTSEFPDVTKTPSGGLNPGPIPYPNQGTDGTTKKPPKINTGG